MDILIVEEDLTMRKCMAIAFRHMNPPSTIVEATSSIQAIDLLISRSFEIVFICYEVSGFDGLAVTAVARKSLPQSAIVFMTGGGRNVQQAALDAGANHFVLKGTDSIPAVLKELGFTIKN